MEVANGRPQYRMHHVRRDFIQRFEDEAAGMHQGVRDAQVGVVDDFISIKQHVEVDDARIPFLATLAAYFALDFQQASEEIAR